MSGGTQVPTREELIAQAEKLYGAGALKLGSDPSLATDYWPTGVLPFDFATGGGLPVGRSVELYGDWSTLKSYIALCGIAVVQANGGTAALIDSEHAYQPKWARRLGVNTKELIVQHPDTGEQAVGMSELLIRQGVDLLVWDSVAAMQPQAYAEAQPGDSKEQQPARLADLMSKGTRRMNAVNSKTAILYINQTRINVGITFGSKVANPGGRALGFYTSQRVQLSKAGKINEPRKVYDGEEWQNTKETVAEKIKITMTKSKLNRPHREVWFVFDYRTGAVDETGFLISQGLENGLITNTGRWKVPGYDDDLSVHGKDKFRTAVEEDEDLWTWLEGEVMALADDPDEADDE